eukprot:g26213.t1
MPLLAENNTYAKPLRATASSTTDSCFFRPDVRVTQFPATQHMEPERRRVHRAQVRLFQDNVVASLTMVEFDTSGSAGQFSWIKRSTCRLAVAKAPELYRRPAAVSSDDHNSFLFRTRASSRRPTGNLCDHCFWANPSLCVNPGSFTGSACVSGEAQRLEEHWRLFSRCQTASAPVESLEALSTELHGLVQRTQPTAEQEAAKDALLRQESLDGCQAELFGSAATKQWMPGSDLDICLLAPGMTAKASQVRGLRKVASALRQLGGGTHNIQPRFHAQMPLACSDSCCQNS